MRLLVVFFKGAMIVICLIVSFSFGMWGLCEINAISELERMALHERNDNQLDNSDASQFKYKGQTFKSQEALLAYIDLEENEKCIVQKFLEDIKLVNNDNVSNSAIFILMAISFEIVGALTDQVKRIVVSKQQRTNALRNAQKVHYAPIFSNSKMFLSYTGRFLVAVSGSWRLVSPP